MELRSLLIGVSRLILRAWQEASTELSTAWLKSIMATAPLRCTDRGMRNWATSRRLRRCPRKLITWRLIRRLGPETLSLGNPKESVGKRRGVTCNRQGAPRWTLVQDQPQTPHCVGVASYIGLPLSTMCTVTILNGLLPTTLKSQRAACRAY